MSGGKNKKMRRYHEKENCDCFGAGPAVASVRLREKEEQGLTQELPTVAWTEAQTEKDGQYTRDQFGVLELTREQAEPYLTRVPLTMDNWQQYFGNTEISRRITQKNDFGDVTKDLQVTQHAFTYIGNADCVGYQDIAFKMNEKIEYLAVSTDENGVNQYQCLHRKLTPDGTEKSCPAILRAVSRWIRTGR